MCEKEATEAGGQTLSGKNQPSQVGAAANYTAQARCTRPLGLLAGPLDLCPGADMMDCPGAPNALKSDRAE